MTIFWVAKWRLDPHGGPPEGSGSATSLWLAPIEVLPSVSTECSSSHHSEQPFQLCFVLSDGGSLPPLSRVLELKWNKSCFCQFCTLCTILLATLKTIFSKFKFNFVYFSRTRITKITFLKTAKFPLKSNTFYF